MIDAVVQWVFIQRVGGLLKVWYTGWNNYVPTSIPHHTI